MWEKTSGKTCLEVCVDSFASAMAAVRGGADRLELCGSLIIGGVTPDAELLRQIRRVSDIPVRCLMRPRFGDFLYTEEEAAMMEAQIHVLGDAGADGFVIGCLTPEGDLDIPKMKRLVTAAKGRGLTLHRAFDVSRDGFKTAREAAELGMDTILTSGQAKSAWEGRAYLEKLLQENLPLTIMAGAGVNARVIGDLQAILPIRTFHMSGKITRESGMTFRREGVPIGLPGIDEFSIWETSEDAVRDAAQVLKGETDDAR